MYLAYGVGLRVDLECITSAFGIVYKALLETMRFLVSLLRSLNLIWMYRRKVFLYHHPIIMVISGYILARNISMENQIGVIGCPLLC